MSITLPSGVVSDEDIVTRFLASTGQWQIVTDGPGAECPACGYPERHRLFDVRVDSAKLTADGCPSCETSRIHPERSEP